MSGHDPLSAAWLAHGSPPALDAASNGRCARCARQAPLVPVRRVVSRSFTGFDGWVDPAAGGLCSGCTWGYRTTSLRESPYLVTKAPSAVALTAAELARVLGAPLSMDRAVTVPARAGRKHVLPAARWGRVTLDDVPLPWEEADVDRLALVARLRAEGVSSRELTAPAPPWRLIQHADGPSRNRLLDGWERLGPWRRRPVWMTLATIATQP